MAEPRLAPGHPGAPPHWTSGAKSGVGTATTLHSRVWFTLQHGIVTEVYFPEIDQACVRDLGFIVTDGRAFFSEEKRDTNSRQEFSEPHLPAYRLLNTCKAGRYLIEKEVLSDPDLHVLLQRVRFQPLAGRLEDYRLFVLLTPQIGNRGMDNTAWVGDYKGIPMLFAQRKANALALASSTAWRERSVGFVGRSDGWQDLSQHKRMEWRYERAEDGHVALTGEIDLGACQGEFVLAVGFGRSANEAAHRARASLADGFDDTREKYLRGWREWIAGLPLVDELQEHGRLTRTSAAVLRSHTAKPFPGCVIASLAVPWGHARGDRDLGGYHLCWPRDMVEAVGGLMAAGAGDEVVKALRYLQATQEADGHWPQNMWLDGTPYWQGIQLDETALPVLLVEMAYRYRFIGRPDLVRFWPMTQRAADYLLRHGPASQEDRWEQEAGYSPFTLAAEVAALLCASECARTIGQEEASLDLQKAADDWNARIEEWTYVTGTDLARRVGVAGYYIRIRPPQGAPRAEIVSPDALALVRFGLRSPHDPRIVDTVRVIDATLKTESPGGPGWRRYTGDDYGEGDDGTPFTEDRPGRGRLWPLLTGERGHYELAAGRPDEARRLLATLEFFSLDGMIPEQIWDGDDLPDRDLFRWRPTGSAMPLAWAHAEYLKLARSIRDGRIFDMPPCTQKRYASPATPSSRPSDKPV